MALCYSRYAYGILCVHIVISLMHVFVFVCVCVCVHVCVRACGVCVCVCASTLAYMVYSLLIADVESVLYSI